MQDVSSLDFEHLRDDQPHAVNVHLVALCVSALHHGVKADCKVRGGQAPCACINGPQCHKCGLGGSVIVQRAHPTIEPTPRSACHPAWRFSNLSQVVIHDRLPRNVKLSGVCLYAIIDLGFGNAGGFGLGLFAALVERAGFAHPEAAHVAEVRHDVGIGVILPRARVILVIRVEAAADRVGEIVREVRRGHHLGKLALTHLLPACAQFRQGLEFCHVVAHRFTCPGRDGLRPRQVVALLFLKVRHVVSHEDLFNPLRYVLHSCYTSISLLLSLAASADLHHARVLGRGGRRALRV